METQYTNGSNGSNGSGHTEENFIYPDVITTSKGARVRLIGLNPARLERLQSAGEMPPVPFREIANDLGAPQKEPLSANDLQNDYEKAQWAEYMEKRVLVENKRNENVMKYIFTDGFDVDTTQMAEWEVEEVEEYGLELSSSRIQRRMDYINARVLGTAADLGDIMAGVLERTGLPANMLEEVRNSFRGNVRQSATPESVAGEQAAS